MLRAALLPPTTLVFREMCSSPVTWQSISFEAVKRTNRFRKSGAVAFGAEFQPLAYNPEIRRQQRLEERYERGASNVNSSKLSRKAALFKAAFT